MVPSFMLPRVVKLLRRISAVTPLILGVVLTASGASAAIVSSTDQTIAVRAALNAVKCEVARFHEKNKAYASNPNAHFVIKDATIRLVLRLVEAKPEGGGGDLTVPVLVSGSAVKTQLGGFQDTNVLEEQIFTIEVNPSADVSTLCDSSGETTAGGGAGSLFTSLERAKNVIENVAVGEPGVRVRTHGIKRQITFVRRTEGQDGLSLAFLGQSSANGAGASVGHELEISFRLAGKESGNVTITASDLAMVLRKARARKTVHFSGLAGLVEQAEGGEPGGPYFLCDKERLKDCDDGSDWAAVPMCQFRPWLAVCAGVTYGAGASAGQGPVIAGPRELLARELATLGWSLSAPAQSRVTGPLDLNRSRSSEQPVPGRGIVNRRFRNRR